jgi:short subunit dehydrogenase-like uncharacterized protein
MLILFGATGYTGRKAAHYLNAHAPEGLEWAIAGRNEEKLASLLAELGPTCTAKTIVADTTSLDSIEAMVAQATVVISTAGPFALYGTPLVATCARAGVHYADITGETPWVRDMIDAHHDEASVSGARIVPCCGVDSIPSDIGAWFVARHINEELGLACREVRCVFKMKGGVSGGTIASALNMGASGETRRLADPLLLNPDGARTSELRARSRDQRSPQFDDDLGIWTTPFVMAVVNTRMVRRSAALFAEYGEGFGDGFIYNESMYARSRFRAAAIAAGLGGFAAANLSAPGRALIKAIGPDPGEGPSDAQLDAGFLHCQYVGIAEDGQVACADLRADGDPGYKVTVMTLCQAGLTLALDGDKMPGAPGRGGVLTSATALGEPYLARMRSAGLTLEVRAEETVEA